MIVVLFAAVYLHAWDSFDDEMVNDIESDEQELIIPNDDESYRYVPSLLNPLNSKVTD